MEWDRRCSAHPTACTGSGILLQPLLESFVGVYQFQSLRCLTRGAFGHTKQCTVPQVPGSHAVNSGNVPLNEELVNTSLAKYARPACFGSFVGEGHRHIGIVLAKAHLVK